MNLFPNLKRVLPQTLLSYIKVGVVALAVILFISLFRANFTEVWAGSTTQISTQSTTDLTRIINLGDRYESYDLDKYMDFLEDRDSNLIINQVSSPALSNKFKRNDNDSSTFGYTASTYWGRLQLQNPTIEDIEQIIYFEFQLDHIFLYFPDLTQKGTWNVKKMGLLYPFSARDINDRLPAFHISIPAKTTQSIYLSFQTTTPFIIQAHLRNPISFWQYRAVKNIFLGLTYGILIFAIFYNLLLFTALNDPIYLYYVIFTTIINVMLLATDGLGITYLWKNAIWWNKYSVFIMTCPGVLSLLQWVSLFLETKKFLPWWHQILRWHQGATIFVFLTIFILPFRLLSISNSLVILCVCSLAIVLGIIAFRRGYLPARYYLLSFSLFPLSIIANQLSQFKIIPAFEWIKDSYRLGMIAFVIFLSLALADRINILKADKLQQKKIALQEKDKLNQSLLQSQAQLLEREKQLEYDILHDALTGSPNRTWLTQRLEYLLQQQQIFAVLFIDLDRFKIINDSLGHLVGDELLKHSTRRIQSILPDLAKVARFGGDEFVVLLEKIENFSDVTKFADLLQMQLQLPFYLNNYELYVSASVGITLVNKEYTQPEEILRDADLAMYQAKHKGRGRYAIFTPSDRTSAMTRLNLERDLRQALERQEFYLCYQPIISLKTQQFCGFEALVRWHHPSGRHISPCEFITIAEETGLINSLGWWIMQEACQQIQVWHQQLGNEICLVINVNVSPVQLRQIDFVKNVKRILQETGLPNHLLKLEITESCLLENINSDINLLTQLKDLGIKLCIDDFGTGYSSLSRLHELPIDTLKIDQSFVKRLSCEPDSIRIIETITSLAHSLNMNTVAEGIETQAQLDKLIKIGCQFGQGYLFSKPCDPVTAHLMLKKLQDQTQNYTIRSDS